MNQCEIRSQRRKLISPGGLRPSLPVEFAGSSTQTKFGDEKYHGRQKSSHNGGLLPWSLHLQYPVLAEHAQWADIYGELERRSHPADFQLNSISLGATGKQWQI